jgi:hypothetical protein
VKKAIVLSCLALIGFGASATSVCGHLKIERVMCVRAPCPSIMNLTPSDGGRRYSVVPAKGSPAERLLNRLSPGTRYVCLVGHIQREDIFVTENVLLKH